MCAWRMEKARGDESAARLRSMPEIGVGPIRLVHEIYLVVVPAPAPAPAPPSAPGAAVVDDEDSLLSDFFL